MQAVVYSDKSVAVFGDTKPWEGNLRELGGKRNSNLGGQMGWIFSRKKEAEVAQFVENANAGFIQPIFDQPAPRFQQTPIVPLGATQPAFTPQVAFNRLQQAQTVAPTTLPAAQPALRFQVAQPAQRSPLTTFQVAQPAGPKPVTALPTHPTMLNFPNLFVAANGLQYQIVVYTTPRPSIDQRVTLTVGDNTFEYVVSNVNDGVPVDNIVITQVLPADAVDQKPTQSRAILMNGEWKIHCMQDDHSLTFHPMQ